MSRIPYPGPIRQNRRAALLVTGFLLLPGCSMSIPMLGADEPGTTGSIAVPVEVQKPLPQSLAYSDATKIGQAAASALWQVDNGQAGEWINAATGSSGTVEGSGAGGAVEAAGCRDFETMVTSIGGVHSYSGKVCRGENGRSTVEIGDAGANTTS